MKLKELKPKIALNKAFLKLKPDMSDIECLKGNQMQFFGYAVNIT